MLGCTCIIHLGIQMPRIRCSKAYAQHQFGILQGLCPTLPILIFPRVSKLTWSTQTFHNTCAPELALNTNIKTLMCSRAHAQHKYFIIHVLQNWYSTQTSKNSCSLGLMLNTNIKSLMWSRACGQNKISSIMCFRVHAQQTQSHAC